MNWIDRTMPHDLVLQTHDPMQGVYATLGFSPEVCDEVLQNPDVESAHGFRATTGWVT